MFYHTNILRALALFLVIILLGSCQEDAKDKSLLIYCAAGMKPALEPIAKAYEKEYNVTLNIQYGGSGTLLSNLRVANVGDLYIAADQSYIDEAIKYDLIAETQTVAYIKPVIAVKKGNPKNIKSIDDLLRDDVDVVIANPDAASIGRQTKEVLNAQESGLYEKLESKIVAQMPTVNEVANTIKIGSSDAGIVWDVVIHQYEALESVEIPIFDKELKTITLGVLKTTTQPSESLKFLRYISSRDKGLKTFAEKGYQTIKGDKWEETPRILFYSGGVNRLAIDDAINEFETREGVLVDRVYNGCGILVSQIKAGSRPDAYFTCDQTFMSQVEDKFTDIVDVSKTDIVIAVQKGNPKNIKSLDDLTVMDLKIGVCNPDQSALGALTKIMLDEIGLWDDMQENISSQSPTADLLINQIRVGSLDAVIVYTANVSNVLEHLDIISIDNEKALAIQNFGISTNSDHHYLLSRLLKKITSEDSKNIFINHGFEWKFKS